MKRYIVTGVVSFLLLFSVSLLIGVLFVTHIEKVEKDVVVDIPSGTSLKRIASILSENGVIKSKSLFLMGVILKGAHRDVKSGEYSFSGGETMWDVIDKLTHGRIRLRKVTIPEGKTIYEVADILQNNQIVSKEEFLKVVTDSRYASEVTGFPLMTLEGFLYPDTYYFPKDSKVQKVVDTMIKRFFKVFNSIKPLSTTWLSDYQVVILASMIEKEAGLDKEKRLISSVYHNRLKKGMKLDCDPTVIYGIGSDFKGDLTKKHLKTYTPYNTYIVKGLPPGPISNPGKESLIAALNPADTNYLYFVSKGDKSHAFSETYRDHVRAVNRYIRRR